MYFALKPHLITSRSRHQGLKGGRGEGVNPRLTEMAYMRSIIPLNPRDVVLRDNERARASRLLP